LALAVGFKREGFRGMLGGEKWGLRGSKAVFFSPRISTRDLARLCRRLATSLEAGIDVRTVWAREAQRATGSALSSRLRTISDAVNQGDSLREALSQTDDFFPGLFRQIVHVGEESGRVAESFGQLAEHYEEQLELRRMLWTASVWPIIELSAAIVVIGLFILILGMLESPVDPLGFGLGVGGLVVFLLYLGLVALAVFLVFKGIRRGLAWARPIQSLLWRLPLVSRPFENLALSRLAWAMHATLDSGMEIRRALRMSLQSTRNVRYTGRIRSVEEGIESGTPIYEALVAAGVFPEHFLDAVRVGEESGRLVESMGLLSRQYRDQAEAGFQTLTKIGGFGVWLLVAAILIMMIFRLFSFYIGTAFSF
jgi:type II secretory pathway component PulF